MSSGVHCIATHVLAVCLWHAAAVPGGAAASVVGSVPDSIGLAELRARLAPVGTVRLVGTFGVREIRRPLVDSAGVRSREWEEAARRRPAVIVIGDVPPRPLPPPIPWSQISEVQIGGYSMARGALLGTFLGGAAGLTLASVWMRHSGREDWGPLVIFSNTLFLGTVIGAFVSPMHGWRAVYSSEVPPPR